MSRTCLVLGGMGFVGSAVVRAALRHGWNATAAGKSDLERLSGTSWDVVINANGNSKKYLSDRDPKLDFDLSVQSVAHSLHNFPCRKYIFLSTVDVYPDKADPEHNRETSAINPLLLSRYGHHKWLAEELVRFNAPKWLIVRLAGFVGPGLKKNPIYDLLTGNTLRVHPDSAYQFQHSDVMADLLFQLIETGADHEIINCAGDGLMSLREIAALIPASNTKAIAEDLRRERYEINIEQMKSRFKVQTTREAVTSFVHSVLQGEVALS